MGFRTASIRTLFVVLPLMVASLTSSGCKDGRFTNMLTKSQEVSLGHQAAQEVEQHYKIIGSGDEAERLQRVADRIIPLAQKDWDVPYTVELIDDKQVNAFALPGGPIYFYRGLVDLAGSDDEVAAVFAHEISHVVKRHSAQQISDANIKGILAGILAGSSGDLVQNLVGAGLTLDQLRFSRKDEAQADEFGFRYLTQAGYDPQAMASFFQKMEAATEKGKGSRDPEWLRSHPLTKTRIEKAEERAKAYRAQHGETNQ